MTLRTRCALNVNDVGFVNIGVPSGLVVENHWPVGPKVPMILGCPFMTQYCPFTPQPKFESKPTLAKSSLDATLQGKPVWNCVMPLICQPPNTLPTMPCCSRKNGIGYR